MQVKLSLARSVSLLRNGTSLQQEGNVTPFPVTRIETISDGTIDFKKVGFIGKSANDFLLKKLDILFSNINSLVHIGKAAIYDSDQVLYHGMNLLLT